MRAVLDPNVIILAALAPGGSPAQILLAWLDGAFELVVSPLLLSELERALGYPKLRKRVEESEARELVDLLQGRADVVDDPSGPPPVKSPDEGDNYLIVLAAAAQAVIISGDRHLLGLADDLPVYSPAEFLDLLEHRS